MAPNTPVMPFGSSLLTITSAPVWREVGNAYDNALAERINGILKLEYGLMAAFHQQALRAIRQAVYLYNVERLIWRSIIRNQNSFIITTFVFL
ncbi:MAG: hypothetical protein R2932_09430 [Caldilineaceae bacterium]